MIGLGIWQLQRKGEKEALLERFEAAAELPPIAYPSLPDRSLLYRRATGYCLEPVGWRARGGQNSDGETGWIHIASCRTGGGEGPGMQVVGGWSESPESPEGWSGGEITGVIALDQDFGTRLVADEPMEGLEAAAPPDPQNIPNNHLLYAIQWFFFAAAAAIIYLLAVRRRWIDAGPAE
ncbi:MAG: SURF1 family protein [Sphingomonadaceae bacterium]|nr:SURF1 family protein [Sphingomonadaceae bacterium]